MVAQQKENIHSASLSEMEQIDNVISDLQGHSVGNELLRQVAQLLKTLLRREDMIARIRGDEFVVILPNYDCTTTMQAVQRLKDTLSEHNRICPPDQALSLYIGMVCGDHDSPLSEVLKEADQAIYLEKADKRDWMLE